MNIEELRAAIAAKRAGLNLRDAAEQIGISKSALSRAENGETPSLENYARLCRWLDVSMDTFFNLSRLREG